MRSKLKVLEEKFSGPSLQGFSGLKVIKSPTDRSRGS
jgi:hypothetical protein